MSSVGVVFTQNILPIFIVAGFGFALQRWSGLDKQALSRAVFYCLSPCLVFASLVNSQLPGDELIALSLFTVITILLMGAMAWGVARLLRLSRLETTALVLMVMFVNGGNYGLTLNQLRYGDDGLARAVVYFTTSTVVLYTVGIFVASMGQLSWRAALRRLWQMPPMYAAVAAVVVYSFKLTVPAPLLRAIEVAGAGAIPVMLLVLGMQMASSDGRFPIRLALSTMTLRLLVAPVLAVGVALLLGLHGVGRSTAIIEASMPPAVFTIILATEFELQPTAVTSIVVVATLLSGLTLAATISWLGL
ncbi:MAG: AEC family transporter [Anaerolinea sp.]|nr:AEC family transporter [Anaerolinea sp.]